MAFRARAVDLLPLVLAAAIPLIFLHVNYQAQLPLGPLTVDGSDVAILLVVLCGGASGLLFGWEPVLEAKRLWLIAGALLAIFVVSNFWQPLELPTKHLVTAAKIGEYMLLAPAASLLFRRQVDLTRFLTVFVAWAGAASLWGLLQFLGIVSEFNGKRPGEREVSFLGHEDFACFTGAAFLVGLAGIALGRNPRLSRIAVAVGALGVVLDAAIATFGGIVLASILIVVVARRSGGFGMRKILALAALLLVMGVGVNTLRGSDVTNYLSFLGIHPSKTAPTVGVQTGSQRVALLYIGLRIWEDHPWLGVGFERSDNRYQPYLAAAEREFPGQPRETFPSPAHLWGIQNYWMQLLADTGVLGFAIAVATYAVGLRRAVRALKVNRYVALVAVSWLILTAATWNSIGIIAGIPTAAVTWLAFGLAVAAQWVDA